MIKPPIDTPARETATGTVLHIVKVTGIAGAENHLLTLLPGLQAHGVPISVLLLTEPNRPMDNYAGRLIAAGIPTRQWPIRGNLDSLLVTRLTRLFHAEQPRAVHTHLIHADWHGIIAARRAGIKSIFMTSHNDDPFRRWLVIRLIQRWMWSRVTAGITISDALRRFAISVEGAPADRITTIHYGLDPATASAGDGARTMIRHELGISPQAVVFGSVCRLIPQKGIDTALRAFWQVAQQLPEAQYIVVGDGSERAGLEAQAAQYRLSHRMHFLGWRDDARALMSALDVFVMPSRWEGFGLVALEAMAARLPVIATNVSALPEIVQQNQTGLLVPPDDVPALAEAMLTAASQPDTIRLMGMAGRQRLETNFTADRMIARTAAVYQAGGVPVQGDARNGVPLKV